MEVVQDDKDASIDSDNEVNAEILDDYNVYMDATIEQLYVAELLFHSTYKKSHQIDEKYEFLKMAIMSYDPSVISEWPLLYMRLAKLAITDSEKHSA